MISINTIVDFFDFLKLTLQLSMGSDFPGLAKKWCSITDTLGLGRCTMLETGIRSGKNIIAIGSG